MIKSFSRHFHWKKLDLQNSSDSFFHETVKEIFKIFCMQNWLKFNSFFTHDEILCVVDDNNDLVTRNIYSRCRYFAVRLYIWDETQIRNNTFGISHRIIYVYDFRFHLAVIYWQHKNFWCFIFHLSYILLLFCCYFELFIVVLFLNRCS